MVLFLDRVYGIENQDFLLHVLDVGFLPDMRAAASLDTVSSPTQPGHLLCLQKGDTRWVVGTAAALLFIRRLCTHSYSYYLPSLTIQIEKQSQEHNF